MTNARFVLGPTILFCACQGTLSGAHDAMISRDGSMETDARVPADSTIDAHLSIPEDAASRPGDPCPAPAAFCDDFEGTGSEVDPALWIPSYGEGAFELDDTTAASGARSLHLRYGERRSVTGRHTIDTRPQMHAPDDRLYVRFYIRFGTAGMPGFHPLYVSVISRDRDFGTWTDVDIMGFGSIRNDIAMELIGFGADNSLIWTEEGDGEYVESGDATPETENSVRAKDWTCVEMMVFGDHQSPTDTEHPNEETRTWIDGVEIDAMHGSDAAWEPLGAAEHWNVSYDNSRWLFGTEGFANPTADTYDVDVWYDAIAISTERVGCLE